MSSRRPSRSRRRRAGTSARLRLVATLLLVVLAVVVVVGRGVTADSMVLLSFTVVLAGRALLALPSRWSRPHLVRRLAEGLVLLAVAGLAVAVRTVLHRTPTDLPLPVLVVVALFTLLVAAVVLVVARQQDPPG